MESTKYSFFSLIIAFIFSCLLCTSICAQVLISEDPGVPDSTAMLEVRSTTKGFLPPRMTGAQRDSIVNPTPGLIIYCTDCMELQLFNDTAWTNFIGLPAKQGFQCGDSLTYGTQNYGTVLVGNKCWMSENLNIGTQIEGMASSNNAIIEKYCYDDLSSNCLIYGALYRWDEMMLYTTAEGAQGICPTGWHLPTDDEYKSMEIFLGMSPTDADLNGYRGTDQGSQLGGIDSLWTDGDLDQNVAFGTSNFDAIPGGSRSNAGNYSQLSNNNYIWTSSESDTNIAWRRLIRYTNIDINRESINKTTGYSVRCILD